MSIDPEVLLAREIPDLDQDFAWRDAALYAIGVGLGAAPTDERIGRFLYAERSVALPSFVNVLGVEASWIRDLDLGIDYAKVLHAEHGFEVAGVIPASGRVRARTRIAEVVDKGREVGALITFERRLSLLPADEPLATVRHTTLARGDGGFAHGRAPGVSNPASPRPRPPDRAPDVRARLPVRPEAGLLFRLNGDLNPLHADPVAARAVGFDRPPLHGLATFGLGCVPNQRVAQAVVL